MQLSITVLLSWLIVTVYPEAQARSEFSILQGSTSETTTHFTVVVRRNESLQFTVNSDSKILAPAHIEKRDHNGSPWSVVRLRFEGLKAKQLYRLQIRDQRQILLDERIFETLPADLVQGRVALISCMVRQLHNPFMWRALENPKNRPDLLLITGDSVYLDRSRLLRAARPRNTTEAWEEFARTRNRLEIFFWKRLVPVISVWDDHDAGGDGVDGHWQMMPEIRKIYKTFFANDEIKGSFEQGPGLASHFNLFGKNFIMLDGRSFRELDAQSPLFGREQESWLQGRLRPGSNFLVSGSQFYGGFIKKDSLEYNWPQAAVDFTHRLRESANRIEAQLAFISGDIHFSEVQDLEPNLFGYWTVEITSSSAHSFAFPGHYILKPTNPRRRKVTGTHNVMLLELNSPAFSFHVRSLGWRGNTLFSTDVAVGSSPCEAVLTQTSTD